MDPTRGRLSDIGICRVALNHPTKARSQITERSLMYLRNSQSTTRSYMSDGRTVPPDTENVVCTVDIDSRVVSVGVPRAIDRILHSASLMPRWVCTLSKMVGNSERKYLLIHDD